jgi:signal recognition particle receptor subunit beta
MNKASRKEPIRLNELNLTPILIALAVVLLTLGEFHYRATSISLSQANSILSLPVIVYFIKKRSPKRTDILLAGLCDSGKTLLYSLLLSGDDVETFTSLKENCGILKIGDNNKSHRVVDLPGHERLRLRLLENYKNSTKAVVYVVDSSSVQKEIRDVAE